MTKNVNVVTDEDVGAGLVIEAKKLKVSADLATIVIKDDGTLAAPGAEIQVLDDFQTVDTDTHYYESSIKFLKHVETGAVWQGTIAVKKERAAPRNEELTADSVVSFSRVGSEAKVTVRPVSAIDGFVHPTVTNLLGDVAEKTGIFAQYANAQEANAALANEKITLTTVEHYALNVDGKPKVLATTFEFPYPELPYEETKSNAYLSTDTGDVGLRFDDLNEQQASEGVEKTFHYKFVDFSGRTYEGTYKTTNNHASVHDCEPSVTWFNLSSVTYSLEPYSVNTFFGRKEVAPESVTAENLTDHL